MYVVLFLKIIVCLINLKIEIFIRIRGNNFLNVYKIVFLGDIMFFFFILFKIKSYGIFN